MNENKNATQYFTIEDVENPKEQMNPNFRNERNKYHTNTAQYVRNSNGTPFEQTKSVKSNKSSSKARRSRDSSWNHSHKRSVNKSKNVNDYSVNSSFNNRNLSRKSRSSYKIKPYSKPWRSGMVKSQKRPQRSDKLNNTDNIKIVEPELMVLRDDSDGSLYSGSDIGEYNEALYSRDSHSARQVNHTAITSLLQNQFNKPNISPKRNKSFYKKKTYTKASKPPLKPYWHRSLDKRNKAVKSSNLQASAKVNTVTNSTEKQRIPSLIRSKTRDINMTKVNNKIFKSLSECLELVNHKEYNKCISKLITIEKLCSTSFPETDVVCIFTKYLLILCYLKCQDYDRCIRNIETLTKRATSLYKKRKLKRETGNLLLQIHKIWADVTMMKGKTNKAAKLYQELIELYSIWKS